MSSLSVVDSPATPSLAGGGLLAGAWCDVDRGSAAWTERPGSDDVAVR